MNPPNHAEPNPPSPGGHGDGAPREESSPAESGERPAGNPVEPAPSPAPAAEMSKSRTRTPGKMRRRVVFGGIAAAVVALAALLQQLIDGLGFGLGPGGGVGLGTGGTGKTPTEKSPAAKTTTPQTPTKKPKPSDNIVEVRLEGSKFYARSSNGNSKAEELAIDAIVKSAERARQARPDSKTAYLRVYRHILTADLTTWDKLKSALREAGFKSSEYEWVDVAQ